MRIVIDMQGAQTESRFRGIGRYTTSFAQEVCRQRGHHEIFLALNGLFPETIEVIRSAFDGLLPQDNIRVWSCIGPVAEQYDDNDAKRHAAELLREAFLASLQPDLILVMSLFEGYLDDAVTSIGRFDQRTPVSVILYDLIPLLNSERYLKSNPKFERYYLQKVEYLRRASCHLTISNHSRTEVIETLALPPNRVFNIAAAVDSHFRPEKLNNADVQRLLQKYDVVRPFVLYTGGSDERKNLPRLIRAWAALPSSVRNAHQLLFAGKMPETDVAHLKKIAHDAGLAEMELRFTGYIKEEELVALYNACRLYVFPSWHEGFGLPALEAMACGAPLIASNATSLPEVVDLDDALFDPCDIGSITAKLTQALQDEVFLERIREHGLLQAKKFSWDETAKLAMSAWESLTLTDKPTYLDSSTAESRLLKALAKHAISMKDAELIGVSSVLAQNQQVGVERQLFLDVSELCQRDSATGVQRVVRSYVTGLLQSPPSGFRIEPVYATLDQGYRYARSFTNQFLGLAAPLEANDPIRWQRGDIFFGLDMQHHVQLAHADFYQQLMQEGVVVKFLVYDLLPIQLADYFKDSDAKELHEQWLSVVAKTDGAICISKATADVFNVWLAENAVKQSATFRTDWVHIGADIEGSKPSHGLPDDAELTLQSLRKRPCFLCVSTLEPRKQQQQIFNAFEMLWDEGVDVNLVFVGQQGWKTNELAKLLLTHPEFGERLFWFRAISDEYLEKVYAASTCLIAASLNEGFGLSLIEAARYGVPIIARDIPIFHEVAGVYADYFKGNLPQDLAATIKSWLVKFEAGSHPSSAGMPWLTWRESTESLKMALLMKSPRHQLLLDISELVRHDARTGIQRVVRSVLREWLKSPPMGYRVEPVYATLDEGYKYARLFVQRFMGNNETSLNDDPIEFSPGDIFFGLDLQPQVQVVHRAAYKLMRRVGVKVKFLVHDLLSVSMPQYFPPGTAEGFGEWLRVVVENDGAVCVSESTSKDLCKWVQGDIPDLNRRFQISWSHNGVDFYDSQLSQGLPSQAKVSLDKLSQRPTFLMVGTLEPRKGHEQVLNAFDQLWTNGADVNLVIVGKQGWMVDSLIKRLQSHHESDLRLFWLDGIDDEYLEKIYSASACLIAASYGEGFGLPLIEAARHKLPIIARDIPVFREVAGEHAYYFNASETDQLVQAINQWLSLYNEGRHPSSEGLVWLTWEKSVEILTKRLLEAPLSQSQNVS